MIALFEAGLPGDGLEPVHLHTGKPTPWSEGCIVRFLSDSGRSCIGNLQPGDGSCSKIVVWDHVQAIVVIARGATYLVWPERPESWRFLDLCGIDCVIEPTGESAILSSYTDVVAISSDGSEKWRRTIAIDGVEDLRIENGIIHGKAGIDPPDGWQSFRLRLSDGKQDIAGTSQYDRQQLPKIEE